EDRSEVSLGRARSGEELDAGFARTAGAGTDTDMATDVGVRGSSTTAVSAPPAVLAPPAAAARPKRLTYGIDAVGASYARYVRDWTARIEQLGTDHYPPEAR